MPASTSAPALVEEAPPVPDSTARRTRHNSDGQVLTFQRDTADAPPCPPDRRVSEASREISRESGSGAGDALGVPGVRTTRVSSNSVLKGELDIIEERGGSGSASAASAAGYKELTKKNGDANKSGYKELTMDKNKKGGYKELTKTGASETSLPDNTHNTHVNLGDLLGKRNDGQKEEGSAPKKLKYVELEHSSEDTNNADNAKGEESKPKVKYAELVTSTHSPTLPTPPSPPAERKDKVNYVELVTAKQTVS